MLNNVVNEEFYVSSYKRVVENSSNKGNMYKTTRKTISATKEDYFEDITDDSLMKFKKRFK